MNVAESTLVALGYGKYFRADRIVGLEPIEEGRGPGRRTRVWIEDLPEPVIASRSDAALLRDIVQSPEEVIRSQEMRHLLADIVDTIEGMNPILRSIIREQAKWDLDIVEERIRDVVGSEQ